MAFSTKFKSEPPMLRQWSSEKDEAHQQQNNERQVFSERLPDRVTLLQEEDGLGHYHLVSNREEPIIISAEEIHEHRRHHTYHGPGSELYVHQKRHPWVDRAELVMRSMTFQILTVVVIAANAVCIGMETDMPHYQFWNGFEWLFLVFFAGELSLRVVVITPKNFFTCNTSDDPVWNIFDFLLVAVGFMSNVFCFFMPEHDMSQADATLFRVIRLFRILRILRVVRVFRFLKQLYLLAYGFFEGAMAVFWVAVLASSIMYCCSIVLVRVYGGLADQDPFIERHFSSVPDAMFSLFEIMSSPTLQSYKEQMYDYPLLIVFIIIYVIFGSFGINGLLTGVISESILDKNQARIDEQRMERETKRRNLYKDTSELFDMMDDSHNGNGSLHFDAVIKFKPTIEGLCKANGVSFLTHDFDHMFDVMDYDDNGFIEKSEFVNGILELCDEIRPMSIMELNSLVSRCLAKVGRTDNKVDTVVRSIEELAFAKRQEAEGAGVLAAQMRTLLENHQRAVEGKDAAGKLEQCERVMHKMKSLVMDVSFKATTEAKVTESLASKLHQITPQGDHAKVRTRPRRKGRLDPKKFQSAPYREEQGTEPSSPLADVTRRRRKSQTYHFNAGLPGEPASAKAAPVSGLKFSNGMYEVLLQPIKETSVPSSPPKNEIRRSTTSPDLLDSSASPVRPVKFDSLQLGKSGSPVKVDSSQLGKSGSPVKLDRSQLGKSGGVTWSPINVQGTAADTGLLSREASQNGDQALTSSSPQTRLGESCERLVQEAMRQVDASSQIQKALESTKTQTTEEKHSQEEEKL